MPTLTWTGKDKVVNHHHEVPLRVLQQEYSYAAPEGTPTNSTDNRIIHGDNLEALKSLLPEFEGRVNCIYIDPPYNTGNEGWVYNDAVNDPRIKKWLGQVVGKEGEDLTRHDKWLCMMYPRMKLLRRLLTEDGIIFVSIDDNEIHNLRPMMDEIYGQGNRIEQFIWKKSYGGGAKEKFAVTVHEYVLCYSKNITKAGEFWLPPDEEAEKRYYKYSDDKLSVRGSYRLKPLEATKSMDKRENLRYSIPAPDGTAIHPKRQWWWAKERTMQALNNNELVFKQGKTGWSVSYKQYLQDDSGEKRRSKPFSIIDNIYGQRGTATLREVFEDTLPLTFPKPVELIERFLSLCSDKNALILDSFAGSGTTAHAVLKLNAQDGGNRRFILCEMMDYAETITAERVRRVMAGYGEGNKATAGLGGAFSYYTVGEPLFLPDNNLNEAVGVQVIRDYVAYTENIPHEARTTQENSVSPYLLGQTPEAAWLFYYEPDRVTSLDIPFLESLQLVGKRPSLVVVYADTCLLAPEFLQRYGLIFKKIPRDITRL